MPEEEYWKSDNNESRCYLKQYDNRTDDSIFINTNRITIIIGIF